MYVLILSKAIPAYGRGEVNFRDYIMGWSADPVLLEHKAKRTIGDKEWALERRGTGVTFLWIERGGDAYKIEKVEEIKP